MSARLRLVLVFALGSHLACKTANSRSGVLDDGTGGTAGASGGLGVLTQHNDNARTGANLHETVLKPSNVNKDAFGKLYSRPTQGRIFAQPLYVPNVTVNGTATNVVYVATMHNMVYAFNADDTSANAQPLWVADTPRFGNPVSYKLFADPVNKGECRDVGPEIGITSTPAIDASTNTMYVVAKADSTGAADHSGVGFWLHALDLATGADKQQPVRIDATAQGTWTDASGQTQAGPIAFDSFWLVNRPGLLLANGKLFIAFGSTCDHNTWRGWILGYDAASLQQTAVFVSTPNGKAVNMATVADGNGQSHQEYGMDKVPQLGGMGGIWQGGMGLAGDDTSVYAIIGNGDVGIKDNNGTSGDYGKNLGNSFVKLAQSDLSVTDWFTPFNAAWMNLRDFDLGASGPMLVPDGVSDKSLLIGGGKQGTLYLLDRGDMGKMSVADVLATLKAPGDAHIDPSQDTQIPQKFEVTTTHLSGPWFFNIHGSPVFWQGPAGPMIYVWAEQDPLKAYLYSNGAFGDMSGKPGVPAGDASGGQAPMRGMPGGMLSISANGSQDGIVWATHLADNVNSQDLLLDGVVAAYDATPSNGQLTKLWDSYEVPDRDDVGSPGKFAPPTVANGKVFVVSNGYDYNDKDYLSDDHTMLQVYGLLGGSQGTQGAQGTTGSQGTQGTQEPQGGSQGQ